MKRIKKNVKSIVSHQDQGWDDCGVPSFDTQKSHILNSIYSTGDPASYVYNYGNLSGRCGQVLILLELEMRGNSSSLLGMSA